METALEDQKYARISITLPEDLLFRLDQHAEKSDDTRSRTIRRAVKLLLRLAADDPE